MNTTENKKPKVRPAIRHTSIETSATLKLALPGVPQEEIRVANEARRVEITADSAECSYHVRFDVPQKYDLDALAADYADGVLTLTLPVAEAARPREIAISSGS